MRERVEQRLGELRSERQAGEKVLAKLEAERADVQQTLLRISGAIQILEELLEPTADADADADDRVAAPLARLVDAAP